MTSMTHRRSARAVPAALAASALLALAACSFPEDAAPREASASNPDAGSAGGTVTLVTHDSFHIDEQLLADFTSRTGLEVQQVAPGDGGALVNQLVLTKGNPLGDLAYGIDNSFASRAVAEGVFVPY